MMELKKYKEGDEYSIIELFELVYNRSMSLMQWLWRFRENPAGRHMIMLMWDGDKLIGHYAVSPILLNVEGVDILTAHSLTTMTHPEYEGRGIFKLLAAALYEDLEINLGVQAIWGYPNSNSHYGFVKNLGWKNIGILHSLAAPANIFYEQNDFSKNGELIEINDFSDDHVELFENDTQDFSVRVSRSLRYLQWRFLEKPSTNYRIFEYRNNFGELFGIMVTKEYEDNEGNIDLNIVELSLVDYVKVFEFIARVVKIHNSFFRRVTMWKNLFSKDHIIFERAGFNPDLPLTYLGIRSSDMLEDTVTDLRNWYFAYGDSDVY